MFTVIARDESNRLGVLDTSDFVVEFVEFGYVKDCVKKGITINGVSYNGAKHTWDVRLSKPILPKAVLDLITEAALCVDDSEDAIIEMKSYCGMLQRSGENMLDWVKKHNKDDLLQILDFA